MPSQRDTQELSFDAENQDSAVRAGVFPKEFERSLAKSMDKRFMSILLLSLFFHILLITYFAMNPPDTRVTEKEIAAIQERFASLVLETPEKEEKPIFTQSEDAVPKDQPKKPAEKATKPAKKATTTRARVKTSSADARKKRRAQASTTRRRTREQIKKAASNQGLLGLLSSSGSSARGSEVEDVLSKGVPNTNLDDALAGVSGLKRADAGSKTGSGRGKVRGSRSTSGNGIDDLVEGLDKSEASGVSRSGDLEVAAATPLIENSEEVASGARDFNAVSQVVSSHNQAIQYCYNRALKRNPRLRGKIVVRFTINPQGSVTHVEIVSSTLNNRQVERCVVSRIKRWNDFGAIDPSKGDTTIRQVYTFGY